MKSKISKAAIRIVSIALAFIMTFGAMAILMIETASNVAVAKASKNTPPADASTTNDLTSGLDEVYLPNYDTEVITKTSLAKPAVQTFGEHEASYYPSYVNKLGKADFTDDKKTAILNENQKMLADVKDWYEAGTLKNNLKKHVSADGQFSNAAGNYDDAPRIEKVVKINNQATPRKRSLGVFAPAGEVITITVDERLVGKLTVNIGYPYEDSDIGEKKFDRWPNDRMARFFLSFTLNDTVNYIGSPLGGMLTLNGVDKALGDFDVTVSGGVDMPNYMLGVSTKDDWQNILATPAPYVWLLTPYQYFVMPKVEIADIADPYDALLFWHKASMISMYSMGRELTTHFTTPVISIYDSYVFIGEAVATVWAFYTNSPSYWCRGVLDYDSLMYSGSWGAMHEYNHHHQAYTYSSAEWGVGGCDEMTNNVINALSYILLTDVALTRSADKALGGWSTVSDPYSAFKNLSSVSANAKDYEEFGTSKLYGFVDLIHNFGASRFIQYLRAMYGLYEVEGYEGTNLTQDGYLTTQDGFALFTSLFFKTDFTDYFTNVWHFELSEEVVKQIQKNKFNKYFSVNNLYAAGVKGIETGRAYQVSGDEETVLKLEEFTNCSTDDYKLTKVSRPKHGKLTKNGDGTYTYAPPAKNFTEDSFELTYKVNIGKKSYSRTLVVKLVNKANAEEERASTKTYPAFVDFRNQYMNLWYSDFIAYTPVEAKCVDDNGNAVKTTGADIKNMFDGNTSTGFHTAWQGAVTAYPHNYYFNFEDEINFNRVNFTFQDNGNKGYYAIGEYEIYTSKDGDNYALLAAGKNEETNFNVQFDKFVSAKYVKLVVKSNSSGKAFTNITELEFVESINVADDYNVYASDDAVFNYDEANWTGVSGNYLNGVAMHTDNGKVRFYLTGTNLMLYSTNAESRITIDGKSYTVKANDRERSPSFIIEGLKNKKHTVVIEGVDMTLDMIKISRGVEGKNGVVNWGGMGVAIAVGVVFLATVVAFIVINLKQKNQ